MHVLNVVYVSQKWDKITLKFDRKRQCEYIFTQIASCMMYEVHICEVHSESGN